MSSKPRGKSGPPGEPPTPERRKPDEERKDDVIRVRVTAEQRAALAAAAEKAGLDLSSWLRFVGLREAQRVVGGP